MPMGYAMKVQAVYPEPFWREKGLSGMALSDGQPVSLSFDNSPNGAKATQGVLLGFIFADSGRTWGHKPEAQRRAAVLQQFTAWFGSQAANPTMYLEQNWTAEPWTRGYVGYMPTDVWVPYGDVVRAPVDRIHWAGSETGQEGMGAMEGGLQAAERVVSEITS
jgi:monoamine oxidase